MAVTKIKPIRGTVNKAIAYILDPQKTDDAFYVSSYGCAASDAAAKEFEWTRNLAVQQGMQMPKVLARHLIQSFDIGEVTPEEAHEVGKQLADEWLKGKYEYVIAIGKRRILADTFQHRVRHIAAGLADHGDDIMRDPAFEGFGFGLAAAQNKRVKSGFVHHRHVGIASLITLI